MQTYLQSLSYEELRIRWKNYVATLDVNESTKNTMCTDALYLFRRNNKDLFWQVVLAENFEESAKINIINTLQRNSKGDILSLVNGYYWHLKNFREYVFNESKQKVHNSEPVTKMIKNETSKVPFPCDSEVEKYLEKWTKLENYHLQENSLNKLFYELCPLNTEIEDVLLKCATLNDFYSTNIYSIYPVAKHIVELNIDNRLYQGDISLVNDIQCVIIGDKPINFYSFATKYCSHHKPEDFPIYDSYVEKILCYFQKIHRFSSFKTSDLKNYEIFKSVLEDFRNYYKLTDYSLKQIDQYLWQLGKEYFPKKYKKSLDKSSF